MTTVEMEAEAHQERVGGEVGLLMEHQEAIETMASEKYLLDELTPELRDAFEEHYFGCPECAQDVRLGSAFMDHSKTLLPQMKESTAKPPRGKRNWLSWLSAVMSPAVMAPAFACLLAVVGYQNLVVYPGLQAAAIEPQVLPPATVLHDETRGSLPVVFADLKLGSTISVELPATLNYDAYKFEFYNSAGKVIWTHTAPGTNRPDDLMSIWLPGGVKQDTYRLVISGVTSAGASVPVKEQVFTLQSRK
jgi:hypothetical protein